MRQLTDRVMCIVCYMHTQEHRSIHIMTRVRIYSMYVCMHACVLFLFRRGRSVCAA